MVALARVDRGRAAEWGGGDVTECLLSPKTLL